MHQDHGDAPRPVKSIVLVVDEIVDNITVIAENQNPETSK